MAPQVDPFTLVGQVLDGQFRVDEVIGEGGFSVVYRGFHVGLGEPIAIKCLKLTGNLASVVVQSFVTRFRNESKLLYRLSQGNLNIVRSIATGTVLHRETGAMIPYMVLEWLEGTSLAADFDARRAEGKTGRSLGEMLDLFAPVVDALTYAHAQGVVHRDLNPGNIFIARQRDGSTLTKVLDFGLAKVVSDHAIELGSRAQTFAQIRVFSPAYASPEQFDGALGALGPASDVYSLANVATEALLDRPILEGTTLGELATKTLDPNYARTPAALGAKVGPAVEAVFKKALAIQPTARFADVATFWSALDEALALDGASDGVAARKTMRMVRPPIEETASSPPPATPPAQPTSEHLKALKATVRMPVASSPGGAAAPIATPAPTAAIVHPAASQGSDPDPAQPSVVVEKVRDPARHQPTMMTRRAPDPVPAAARATVLTRAVPSSAGPAPAAEVGQGRGMRVLVGLLVFFAIVSVGTAALFVVQRMSH